MRLEYSIDYGSTWTQVRSGCLPSDPTCTEYWPSSDLVSDLFVGSARVTIPLPRENCEVPTEVLPTFLVSDFEDDDEDWQHWDRVVCSRYLETGDLDLREALFVQFDLRTGCQVGGGGRPGGAVGIDWELLRELDYNLYKFPSKEYILLPQQAMTPATVFRIGSHDLTPSCTLDLSDPQRALDKGVILQYSADNGITWATINVHDPLDFRKGTEEGYQLIPTDIQHT
ncbi:hypothetical protein Pmani_020829 [Petrolisthes manimaculis]|uniref:Reelin n=1 Tax=Petrolisthes manimaculis TaxID=1843537 RepID=A0AAE1U5W7_9EUCA|nr:hypothetical protein Pmani_020829 [Petrolisthes manimaculis]